MALRRGLSPLGLAEGKKEKAQAEDRDMDSSGH